jgi:uncharacterized phiE125 gp8 family phage protein
MDMTLVTAPASEPVLADMDLKNHLRLDGDEETETLELYIKAARQYVEEGTHRALITQTWRLTLDCWPDDTVIKLPRPPLQSVTDIKYLDEDGTESTWGSSNYIVDTDGNRISLAANATWPTGSLYPVGAIRVTFVAGFGSDGSDVPEYLRQAIRLLAGHWYEHRETTLVGGIARDVPFAVKQLIRLNKAY